MKNTKEYSSIRRTQKYYFGKEAEYLECIHIIERETVNGNLKFTHKLHLYDREGNPRGYSDTVDAKDFIVMPVEGGTAISTVSIWDAISEPSYTHHYPNIKIETDPEKLLSGLYNKH